MVDELKNLVEESFLGDEVKRNLLRFLELGNLTEFWPVFNYEMIEEIKRRQKRTEEVLQRYESEIKKLENNFFTRSQDLEEEIKFALLDISEMDLQKREQLWNDYYAKRQILQKDLKENIVKLLSVILLTEEE